MFDRSLLGAQAAGPALAIEIGRGSEPDAVGNLKRLVDEPFEQLRLSRRGVVGEHRQPRRNSVDAVRAEVARVFSRDAFIASKSAKSSAGNRKPMGPTGLRANTLPKRSGSISSM